MRKITIVPYDDRWPVRFQIERTLLQKTLSQVALQIHHIGSTSVPGLAAKPVIDILIEVGDLTALDKRNGARVGIGYSVRGENGIAHRSYFTKGGDQRTHQVHAFATGDIQIVKHLAFRDYLRAQSPIADQYAAVKQAAASDAGNTGHGYQALKADFIEHHLRLAFRKRASGEFPAGLI